MSGELFFLGAAIVDLGAILFLLSIGREWVYASIVVNLLLISVLGVKLVSVLGFVTNVGNIFYACVFFATYLLLECGDKEAHRKIIGVGVASVVLFILMSQLVLGMAGVNFETSQALSSVFRFLPRIAFASLAAYIIAQHLNIAVYTWLKDKTGGKKLWLRSLAAIFSGQAVDSLIFFAVAFAGVISVSELLGVMWFGFLLKVGIGLISLPLLYVGREIIKAGRVR